MKNLKRFPQKYSTLAALAAFCSCQHSEFDEMARNTVAALADANVSVSVDLSQTAIHAGDSLTLRVIATNVSSHSVRLDWLVCPLWFEVLSDSTPVGPENYVCPAVLATKELKHGESHTTVYVWRGNKNDLPGTPSVPLSPGNYVIRGQIPVDGKIVRGGSAQVRILP